MRPELRLTAATQVLSPLAFPTEREGPARADGLTGPSANAASRRVLVAGVGYTCLSDLSAGPALVERLQAQSWPAGVIVEDLSYGPIDVLFKLQGSPPFAAAVFATAVNRGGAPGMVRLGRWTFAPLPPEVLQARMAEAVTGVISLDNLLHILGYFGALPPEVVVFEIEPSVETWGTEFSPPVRAALAEAEEMVRGETERLLTQERGG